MEQSIVKPDFRIYTASLVPVGGEQPTVVRMTGSSTQQDTQRNRMTPEALRQMQNPALVGMNIFLNHRYELPHDLYGKLVATPDIVLADGFIDIGLTVDTDIKNPPAAQTLQQIRDNHKHGCSIGCMVNKWAFASENDDPSKDPIVIQDITPIEWSVVGIPANRRCWVENAVQGKFMRTLDEGDYDQALQLAPTVKSLFSYDYDKAVLRLGASERKAFEQVQPRPTPTEQIFWQPQRSIFIMQSNGHTRDLTRLEVKQLLQASWGKDAEVEAVAVAVAVKNSGLPETHRVGDTFYTRTEDGTLLPWVSLTSDSSDGGKAAQKSRSARYGIGVKDGGNVTKPGKWSSVPDSQWGDPVNYRYPMPDKAHADNAASRWGDASNRSQYNSHEQSIIGGRIKRRQAHFGSSSGDAKKSMKTPLVAAHGDTFTEHDLTDAELVDADGSVIPLIQLDAANYHAPLDGLHAHAHSHGPQGEMHTHVHVHHNTSAHIHDHTGNLDNDGGAPDGDGDQDDYNEPPAKREATPELQLAAQGDGRPVNQAGSDVTDQTTPPASRPGGGSGSVPIHPPNDASGNTGRANNSGATGSGSGHPPNTDGGKIASVPVGTDAQPGKIVGSEPLRASERDPELLAMYNSLGKRLHLGTVDANGMRSDGISMETVGGAEQAAEYLNSFKQMGLQMMYAADNIALQLGVTMPYLRFSVDPTMQLAGSPKAQLDAAHAVHVQSIHDHANAVLSGAGCKIGMGLKTGEAEMTASTPPVVVQPEDVQKKLIDAEHRILTLDQQIAQLQGRGMGRPTSFVGRVAPVIDFEQSVVTEVKSSDELRVGTFIAKRNDGVRCRQWPHGHGIHQRPRLSSDQMSIMSVMEIDRYYAGQEVLVPMIFEGD